MAGAGETEVVNVRRLEASTGGDRALLLELVDLYLADTDAKLPTLIEAARARAFTQVGRVAHGLKGASASLGCEEAAAAFRCLEEIGRAEAAARLDDALAEAQAAWRRACSRLRGLAA